MVIFELAYLARGLAAMREGRFEGFPAEASRRVAAHWDHLRWLLAINYRYNGRLDTPFWRAARAELDVSGMTDLLSRFRREGPWPGSRGSRFTSGDPAFGDSVPMTLLLGQRAPGVEHARPNIDRTAWDAMVARARDVAAGALSHAESLEVLSARPDLLRELVDDPSSWIHAEGECPTSVAGAGWSPG
jgi:tryptophan halogenase